MSQTDNSTNSIATLNPLRYRSYVYDQESGFYYLQSRYYDSQIGRFLNADIYCDTGTGSPLSTNMFAYCGNNSVNMVDDEGVWPTATLKKNSNFISLEVKVPWKDIELYFTSRAYTNAVIGIIASFIPEPTVSKALGVTAGIDSIISSIISDVIAKKKSGKSIKIGFSFNYKIINHSKYVYIINTKWVKIGFWSKWKTAKVSNIKWWVKL